MKVILQADVKGHGKKGDLVEIADGYARNFIIPRKLGIEATKANINTLQGKKESAAYHKDQELSEATALAAKLSELTVSISAKAGEHGKLFGSITNKDVAEAIKYQHHIVIDKKKIHLPEGIKTVGITEVEIKVYPEITAKVKVSVIAE